MNEKEIIKCRDCEETQKLAKFTVRKGKKWITYYLCSECWQKDLENMLRHV